MTHEEAWKVIFDDLEVTTEAQQSAVKEQWEPCIRHQANLRGFLKGINPEYVIKWRANTLACATRLADLLQKVPSPYDEDPLFFSGDPDNPDTLTCEQVLKIVKSLSEDVPPVRPRHRPPADYSDDIQYVKEVEPLYLKLTRKTMKAGVSKKTGSADGPAVRIMHALLVLAGERRPVLSRIRIAIEAHRENMKRSNKR